MTYLVLVREFFYSIKDQILISISYGRILNIINSRHQVNKKK